MIVSEMLDRMSSHEITYWQAYYRLKKKYGDLEAQRQIQKSHVRSKTRGRR